MPGANNKKKPKTVSRRTQTYLADLLNQEENKDVKNFIEVNSGENS